MSQPELLALFVDQLDHLNIDYMLTGSIEAKSTGKITPGHLKGLRRLEQNQPDLKRRIIVCLEEKPRETPDGIEVLPAQIFAKMLWEREIF